MQLGAGVGPSRLSFAMGLEYQQAALHAGVFFGVGVVLHFVVAVSAAADGMPPYRFIEGAPVKVVGPVQFVARVTGRLFSLATGQAVQYGAAGDQE